ncbi:MAG: urate oxidase [Phycisphaerae bacterium]|nr:urate oxidase [Phycisphaerae bacterium]
MTASLAWNRYGKSLVRVMKVTRTGPRHNLRELSVNIGLEGNFTAAHTRGDNSAVLPTDTMKNTVYALARTDPVSSIESFARLLARHFVNTVPHVALARVEITETQWQRIETDATPHNHTFQRLGPETPACTVESERGSDRVRSGLRGLVILKSAQSAFSGFMRDKFTTLKETDDRIMGTSVTAAWPVSPTADFNAARHAVRQALISTFAAHQSLSVQQTLFAMGEAALRATTLIDEITLSLPNKHCLLVDLAPFGLTNPNEIFLPIDEPHGLIEATIRRN